MSPDKQPGVQTGQFDFLIGLWKVRAIRQQPDGSEVEYAARWHASKLASGRMVMDEFTALAPDGRELSSFVTLRTYCDATERWEMAGLAASQPAVPAQWHGCWEDGEMRLEASGHSPQGRAVRSRIRFFAISPDGFHWESQASADDGQTWTLTSSLVARRAD